MSGFGDAEDNAAMLVRFPAALAVLEASWTTFHIGVPNGPIVYGTKGRSCSNGDDIRVYAERGAKGPSSVEKGDFFPRDARRSREEFLHHLETSDPLHPTLDSPINLATMAILDAGIRSAKNGAAAPVGKPPYR